LEGLLEVVQIAPECMKGSELLAKGDRTRILQKNCKIMNSRSSRLQRLGPSLSRQGFVIETGTRGGDGRDMGAVTNSNLHGRRDGII